MNRFPAHIAFDEANNELIQTTQEHCCGVAEYAARILKCIGLENTAKLVGILHDVGKFTVSFSRYITRAVHGQPVKRGSVNHTFASVRLLLERYYVSGGDPFRNMTCKILAFACGSHHGQFDCIDPNGKDGFSHRTQAENINYSEAKENFLNHFAEEEIDALFDSAVLEIQEIVDKCNDLIKTEDEILFYLSFVCRSVLSALIDSDRQDTAKFMHGVSREDALADMTAIWKEQLSVLEGNLKKLPGEDPISKIRQSISEKCGIAPEEREGVYRLSIPTGAGKTLSALRFALATAAKHNKRRVALITPLLSVLEQNAEVIRENLDADEIIIEHHSNIVREEATCDEFDPNELLVESWNAAIIITSFVQFLNTLFDGRTSCIRRFAALADSVIVIDEIQSLPRNMISLFNMAVNFLVKVCHASVILCSATQPCLEQTTHSLYINPPEIVQPDPEEWQVFRRTEIIDRQKPGGYTAEELADFSKDLLDKTGSVLVICNKKNQAKQVFNAAAQTNAKVFHLSTSMCMAHRKAVLEEIKLCLNKVPVICVATQLVEAGVDFSFGCVIRVLAGIDNIVQAAGRCNRNREHKGLCPVYIVNYFEENLGSLPEIRQAQVATMDLLACYREDTARFDSDLSSISSIDYYYKKLFSTMSKNSQDFYCPEHETTIYDMLTYNERFREDENHSQGDVIAQAFKTAGQAFKVFENNTIDVLVPYGEGKELILQLGSERAKRDFSYQKEAIDKAKMYTVSLFSYQIQKLQEDGGLQEYVDGSVLALLPSFYKKEIGVDLAYPELTFLEA